jgi:uncharacterized membrane protein
MNEAAPERQPPRWLLVAMRLPIQLGWIVMLWAGWRIATSSSVWLGLILLVVGGVTAYLAVRSLIASVREPTTLASRGEARGPAFDSLIWSLIGLPIVLVAALLAVAFLAIPPSDIRKR